MFSNFLCTLDVQAFNHYIIRVDNNEIFADTNQVFNALYYTYANYLVIYWTVDFKTQTIIIELCKNN